MPKQTLYKLFFSDLDAYKKEYENRFNDEETIHLNIDIGDNPAFICQTAAIYRRLISIERNDKKINLLCDKLPGVAIVQFAKRCLIDEIILTNNIEGVYSTRRDISTILQDLSINNKKERFVGLVRKYSRLMQEEIIPIKTCQDIRNIYDDIFYEEVKASDPNNLPDGEIFRKDSVSVYSKTDKEIHRGLLPESKVISVMERALHFLNDDAIEPLFRTAIFHYLFGYIHPFYDGNGRTSRFISSYLLSKELNPLIGYRISYTIKDHINQYYNAFKICNDSRNKGDLTPFVEMFMEIVDISAKQLCDALEKRVYQFNYYLSSIENLPGYNNNPKDMSNLYSLLIQAALFSEIGISRKELENEMGLSYNTLRSRLAFIPKELLIESRQERHIYYMLNLDEVNKYLL